MNIISYAFKGLHEFLLSKPWAYQDEMQQFLYDDFKIWVDVSTISRVLFWEKMSRKKVWIQLHLLIWTRLLTCLVTTKSSTTCERLRDEWKVCLTEWRPDQLMFIDESAANERTLDRKYRWSRIGTQCVVTEQLKSSQKWSILSVYTQDGYIAWDISSWVI